MNKTIRLTVKVHSVKANKVTLEIKKAKAWTRAQDTFYGECFGYYMRNVRADQKRADAYAWRQTVERWPELAK